MLVGATWLSVEAGRQSCGPEGDPTSHGHRHENRYRDFFSHFGLPVWMAVRVMGHFARNSSEVFATEPVICALLMGAPVAAQFLPNDH